ncbi:acyl-CoA thioesterase [Persephonella sp.]
MIYRRKVFFYETDAQGIVHHSNYPRYFEEARGFYLEQIGHPYEKIREEYNIDIVLVSLSVQYRKPLFFGDTFEIHFSIPKMDRFRFSFRYTVKKDGETVAVGETEHVCLDRKSRKIVSIPEVLRI